MFIDVLKTLTEALKNVYLYICCIVSEARVSVSKAQELVAQITSSSRRQNKEFEMWNNTVASKLDALRSKIMQARHIADGVMSSLKK